MTQAVSDDGTRGGRLHIPRSRGAASGFLIVLLGLWGALVPFVGPAFNFAYNPEQGAAWSAARGWLEVLPGVVAVLGGLVLMRSRNRAAAMLGGWLSVIAGAWYVVGRVAATTLTIGEIGGPVAETDTKAAWLELTYFYGLGALIVFLGATALGRLSVRSGRDISHAQRSRAERHAETLDATAIGTDAVTGRNVAQPGDTSASTMEGRSSRRGWRNPLGRRRDHSTPVDR